VVQTPSMLSPSRSKIADLAITGASPRPADPGNTSSKNAKHEGACGCLKLCTEPVTCCFTYVRSPA
jgi:hypothetical protein